MNKIKQLNPILPVKVNKSVVFYSPVDGNSVLVRTGTIDDDNTFYHGLIHGYSKDYINMPIAEKTSFVERLKSSSGKHNLVA